MMDEDSDFLLRTNARALLKTGGPESHTYAGLGRERLSRMMTAICVVAAKTGLTMNAALHLNDLRERMLRVSANG